jgi:protein-tyrosine kinase
MSKVHEALRRAERERDEVRRVEAPGGSDVQPAEPAALPGQPARTPPAATEVQATAAADGAAARGAASPAAPAEASARRGDFDAAADTGRRRPLPPHPRPAVDIRMSDALVAFTKPRSMAAEQYRTIRQQIAAFGREMPIRTIVVTSALAGEGKTTTACNLAISLGQELGRRVCLVDCDLRNPQVGAVFGLPPRDGLADVLRRRANVDAVLLPTPVNDLWLLPAGHLPPNPAELLGSAAMRQLLGDLKDRFDLVIIDSPPVLPMADPSIIGQMADGVVVVLLAGRTPRRLIDRTLDRLHGAVLLGFVLNRTDEFQHYAEYYAYDYGA